MRRYRQGDKLRRHYQVLSGSTFCGWHPLVTVLLLTNTVLLVLRAHMKGESRAYPLKLGSRFNETLLPKYMLQAQQALYLLKVSHIACRFPVIS